MKIEPLTLETFMRPSLVAVPLLGVSAVAGGCAPPRAVGDLGPALAPTVQVHEEWKQRPTLTVDLPHAAYVALFVVVPNHAAELLAPVSEPDAMLSAGTHVLRATWPTQAQHQAGVIDGGTYPDLGASCAVPDLIKETNQISTGPDGREKSTDVITFATPTTSPPIVTCAVPGVSRVASAPRVAPDRYLLVVATDRPVARAAIVDALERLDVTGSPREVTQRVAGEAARVSHATEWGARAIRY